VLAERATDEADVSLCLFSALKRTGIGDAAEALHTWAGLAE
jgi:GTP-binding protein